MRINIGDSFNICVDARSFRNYAKLFVNQNETYRFELINFEKPWRDFICSSPLFGFRKSWMYWFVKPRISYGNYFALSGGVGNNDDYLFIIFSNASDVESGKEITMPADGELFLFANDAKYFYFNNHGRVNIKITRKN